VDIVSRVFFSDPFNFDVKEDHIALDIDLPWCWRRGSFATHI
jgi:hypothetical protein